MRGWIPIALVGGGKFFCPIKFDCIVRCILFKKKKNFKPLLSNGVGGGSATVRVKFGCRQPCLGAQVINRLLGGWT